MTFKSAQTGLLLGPAGPLAETGALAAWVVVARGRWRGPAVRDDPPRPGAAERRSDAPAWRRACGERGGSARQSRHFEGALGNLPNQRTDASRADRSGTLTDPRTSCARV